MIKIRRDVCRKKPECFPWKDRNLSSEFDTGIWIRIHGTRKKGISNNKELPDDS